mmetsp:Transcript_17296/g.54019  ORF Transcript_17296/g.54019 Transcript_17296/m.54019 type:complete len:598 (+) Transcript_17296:588-2381(+)
MGAARRRLEALLADTKTKACRDKVTDAFIDSYERMLNEDWLPFEQAGYSSDCPKHADPAARAAPKKADDIRLAYLLVVHEAPEQIMRLVEALEEGGRHQFVIHVDDKPASAPTQKALLAYASNKPHVRVMTSGRQSVAWGGFNVVQATLNGLALIVDELDGLYDWIVTASGYTYPLASNRAIREELAKFPADTEFLEIRPQPNDPMPRAWHQFVECDDKMRRIYRYLPPRRVKMYMGSQWMIITKDFASYATGTNEYAGGKRRGRNTFASQYLPYAKHTMVADENYFTTVAKNSPMCQKHHNSNFLHVQFDQWENEKQGGPSDNKCLQPDPNHCGRSPTTLTHDYLPVLELGGALFARKFDMRKDSAILDAIDATRAKKDAPDFVPSERQYFEGVRIARRAENGADWCVTLDDRPGPGNVHDVRLEPCDRGDQRQRFNLGPCSSDGNIQLRAGAPANVAPGDLAPAPFCPVARHFGSYPVCLDLNAERLDPGTRIIGYPCNGRWNQLVALGTGAVGRPDAGALFISVPYPQHPVRHLCFDAPARTNAGAAAGAENARLHVSRCHGGPTQTFFVEPGLGALYAAPPRPEDYLTGEEEL